MRVYVKDIRQNILRPDVGSDPELMEHRFGFLVAPFIGEDGYYYISEYEENKPYEDYEIDDIWGYVLHESEFIQTNDYQRRFSEGEKVLILDTLMTTMKEKLQ